ncbi:MAG: type II secretion system protein M [Woeseiaceae bacterium]|nr:type II secretion system protein M [Woeseiaceae bacterium]
MKDWFYGLEQREQVIVGVGGVIAVLILLWALVWMPLNRAHDDAQANLARWQSALADLQVVAANLNAGASVSTTSRPVNITDSPVVIVDRTLREHSLNNTARRQQPTPNGVRVEFENVAFDQLVVWLGDLNSRYSMDVQAGSLSIASRSGPGRINASLTLERAP